MSSVGRSAASAMDTPLQLLAITGWFMVGAAVLSLVGGSVSSGSPDPNLWIHVFMISAGLAVLALGSVLRILADPGRGSVQPDED